MSQIFLDHFIEAHKAKFEDALLELKNGRKETHWIWFIFPVIRGLGKSETAQYYAIDDLNEAKAFINHKYLGSNYEECLEAILEYRGENIGAIMASRIDKWKLRASLTLFDLATSEKGKKDQINSCLNEFYDGKKCFKTLKRL